MKQGLAPDGGLYMPDNIPVLPDEFWKQLQSRSIQDLSIDIVRPYLEAEINGGGFGSDLPNRIIQSAITFDAPLVQLKKNLYLLELFHGPTLAFKDFGARFMARAFSKLDNTAGTEQDLLVLVATSGDTGSAVAHGFYGVEGTRVCLLYPSGKVSELQEKQMTTLGGNVHALEVDGTFDQCQSLVKKAFSDRELRQKLRLSSANSINIARLLPQSFYYVYGLGQLQERLGPDVKPIYTVPSGNFGNLVAGLIAMKMGMPVTGFIAATNRNDVVPKFLSTGRFTPKKSVQTISNAMDVGNPSNFERIEFLFDKSHHEIQKTISGASFSDEQTREAIGKVYRDTGYTVDPHTAVGILAAESYLSEKSVDEMAPVVVLSTAHPSKFRHVVEEETGRPVDIPERLKACMNKKKIALQVESGYDPFRQYLQGNLDS